MGFQRDKYWNWLRKSEGQGKFKMVTGVMQAGMMQQVFRLVGGQVRAVR